jgi:hypothetical protein
VPFRVLLEEKEKKNGTLRALITCESPMFSLTTMNTQFIGTYLASMYIEAYLPRNG